MTLREIMKTNVGPERLEPSLPQETEIHHLRPEAVDEGVVYEVVNELGDKVGELAGSQLAFLVRRAVELDLNELLNAIEDGVVVLDREGRICYENEAYSRIIGVPMRKTIGRDMHVIEPDALLLRVLESGKPDARKWHRIKSVGKYVSMRMFPVWRNGVVAGAFSIFRDVTELNRLGMEVERITQVAEELTSQLDVELSRFQMIGQDPQFRTLLSRAVTAAKTDATVLIRGENGVGKEGFAKLIHQASPRRNRPFITVNCAAIPEALIESELFGYEEGSFTGARKGGKLGKFELAQGGTLFLDEVGDAMKMRRTAASLEYPCARPSGGICMSLSRMLCCFGCWRAESPTPESGTASNRWGNMYLCACFPCGGTVWWPGPSPSSGM